jgi:hypothetical protein
MGVLNGACKGEGITEKDGDWWGKVGECGWCALYALWK